MKGDSQKSVDFLKKFYPKGPWLLTSIQTDRKGISTQVFGPNTEQECLNWIDLYNGDRNIYFTVNRPNNTFLKMDRIKKPNKEDMFSAGWLHVDIDPPEPPSDTQDLPKYNEEESERILSQLTDRLPKGIPEPTAIIFSGGGFQAFWKLGESIKIDGTESAWTEFELYNKRMEQIFGGDHCHNVDRIMRLPGSINVPDAKKLKKGRVPKLATLLQFESKNVYELSDFKKAQAVQSSIPGRHDGGEYGAKVEIPGNIEKIQDLSELDKWDVPDRIKVVIAQGQHPDQPKDGDNSRSAWLFDCVCGLARCNVPDGVIFAILTDPEWGISSSVVELKGGAERYAIRQIKRAKEYSEDPHLTQMNDRHAIIGNIGGKCRVIEEIEDDVLHRSRITMSSFEDIRNRYGNIQIQIGTTDKNDPVHIPLGKYWINHRMRRQYDTMKFMPQGDKPGVYNLWRGFGVAPDPTGSCQIYLDHIRNTVCNGVEEHYDYFIKWMANCVQNPATQGEVAIVMRGGKGTGKSLTAKVFGRLFGRHYLHVANSSHLVGNFNAHLRDVIFLFADEAFFAGDKRHESVQKMLITENSIPIEAKGVDVEPSPNYVHLMMSANDPHVIRASGDERRYFVVEVEGATKQSKEFFGAMMAQMEDGGYENLLYVLQNVDISDFQVRNVPTTDALQDQKLLSMGVEEEWWYHKLHDGFVLEGHDEWSRDVLSEALERDFTTYADKWKFTRRGNATILGKFLNRTIPHIRKVQRRVTIEEFDPSTGQTRRVAKRLYHYDLGTLEDCRKAWDKLYGEREWPSPVELDLGTMEPPF